MPSTSSLIASGWSPRGSYSDLISKGTPPSDFSGRGGRCGVHTVVPNSGRPSRSSDFQRVGGGGDAERLHLVARGTGEGVVVLDVEAELLCQLRIERRHRGGRAVVGEGGLRRLVEAGARIGAGAAAPGVAPLDRVARHVAVDRRLARQRVVRLRRGARPMRGGLAAGPAILGIVRRRLQSGAGADAGIAGVDSGVEQFRERRPDRLHLRPMRLRARRFGGILLRFCLVGGLGHGHGIWPRECRDGSPAACQCGGTGCFL